MVKLSVCMATRNGERYIEEQLASILMQLDAEDEVVVSDDSSTDGTVEIVRSLADPRVRLLEGNAFFSPIFNLENALSHATGDLITLADQDDVWLPGKAELIRNRLGGGPGTGERGTGNGKYQSPVTSHGFTAFASSCSTPRSSTGVEGWWPDRSSSGSRPVRDC